MDVIVIMVLYIFKQMDLCQLIKVVYLCLTVLILQIHEGGKNMQNEKGYEGESNIHK